MPSITYVPGSTTSTVSGLTVITELVFTRKFELSDRALNGPNILTAGAIAGIVIGAFAGIVALSALIFFYLRRRKDQRAAQMLARSPGGGEMLVVSPASATHELASPHDQPQSPGAGRDAWMSRASPPAYVRSGDPFRTKTRQAAQELPGSTFIFEHHPAYTTGQEEETTTALPSSPPRTPATSSPQSPHAKTTSSPVVVSPLGSPQRR